MRRGLAPCRMRSKVAVMRDEAVKAYVEPSVLRFEQ